MRLVARHRGRGFLSRNVLDDVLYRRPARLLPLRQEDDDVVTRFAFEVGNAREQDAVGHAACDNLELISLLVADEFTNDAETVDGANLLVDESAVGSNGELELVTFDELRLRRVVRREALRR